MQLVAEILRRRAITFGTVKSDQVVVSSAWYTTRFVRRGDRRIEQCSSAEAAPRLMLD
jgi:hypothetical protein